MTPGCELDALVAEKVMGLKVHPSYTGLNSIGEELPPYSTDIAAAWEVVERVASCAIEHEDGESRAVVIAFRPDGLPHEGRATDGISAPHAICLAALKAVGAL